MEDNFQDPMFKKGPPLKKNNHYVGRHTEPLCKLNYLKTLLENYFLDHMFIKRPRPTT